MGVTIEAEVSKSPIGGHRSDQGKDTDVEVKEPVKVGERSLGARDDIVHRSI